MYDVIIVGGGPSGLSAALVLGRCRRRVLIYDHGHPRNAVSRALHGFLTRDGTPPLEFLRMGREELKRYPTVELRTGEVIAAERGDRRFRVKTADGRTEESRILLLATGMVDELPDVPGLRQFWGKSVHVCPYCDGWERRDQALAVFGQGKDGFDLALEMRHWSHNVTLCTNGPVRFTDQEREQLTHLEIPVREQPVERFEGEGEDIRRIVFRDGSTLPCDAVFLCTTQRQRSELALSLGCQTTETSQIACTEMQSTHVPGVYVVGNASHGLQLVIVAVADGTQAAFAINEALREADLPVTGEEAQALATGSCETCA